MDTENGKLLSEIISYAHHLNKCLLAFPERSGLGRIPDIKGMPDATGYEFCSTVSHLLVAAEKREDPAAVRAEYEKAKRHVTRAVLDFLKYRAFVREDGAPAPAFEFLAPLLKARLAETDNIGTSHTLTIELYQAALESRFRKEVGELTTFEVPAGSFVFDENEINEVRLFFRLEAVHSGLIGKKSYQNLKDFYDIFFKSEDVLPALARLNRTIAADLSAHIVTKYREDLEHNANSCAAGKAWLLEKQKLMTQDSSQGKIERVVPFCEALFTYMGCF